MRKMMKGMAGLGTKKATKNRKDKKSKKGKKGPGGGRVQAKPAVASPKFDIEKLDLTLPGLNKNS
jgi:hypothetical protein